MSGSGTDSIPRPSGSRAYLGLLVPAWLLWMGAALRRLPTWPLRAAAITFVAAASGFSALSNHLIYRNPPFQRAADIAAEYFDPAKRTTLAVGHVDLTYPGKVVPLVYDLAQKIRPLGPGSWFLSFENFQVWLDNPDQALNFRAPCAPTPRCRPSCSPTAAEISPTGLIFFPTTTSAKGWARGWKRMKEEEYQLHFEWRFYIYNTWRTRVWVRDEESPPRRRPRNRMKRFRASNAGGQSNCRRVLGVGLVFKRQLRTQTFNLADAPSALDNTSVLSTTSCRHVFQRRIQIQFAR